jgi:hypothetical protein
LTGAFSHQERSVHGVQEASDQLEIDLRSRRFFGSATSRQPTLTLEPVEATTQKTLVISAGRESARGSVCSQTPSGVSMVNAS